MTCRRAAPPLFLGYHTLKDPRDVAEVIHVACAFGAHVHLLGRSLAPDHPKVLRRLRSWRPALASEPATIPAKRLADAASWIREVRRSGRVVVGTVCEGGESPSVPRASAGLAILFGEETHGLPRSLLSTCDVLWTLPLGPGGRFFTVGQATALILGKVSL